jgi:hypothetical protein
VELCVEGLDTWTKVFRVAVYRQAMKACKRKGKHKKSVSPSGRNLGGQHAPLFITFYILEKKWECYR